MTAATARTIYKGSVEYLSVTVTADVTLDAQPVAISFDRTTWVACTWQGTAGLTRTASVLANDANLPATNSPVFVKVTDSPEVPIVNAGTLYRP